MIRLWFLCNYSLKFLSISFFFLSIQFTSLYNKNRENVSDAVMLTPTVLSDLQIDDLVNRINFTYTCFGKDTLHTLLTHPIGQVKTLKKRQNVIKQLSPIIIEKISDLLNSIKIHEESLKFFGKYSEDMNKMLHVSNDSIFYKSPIAYPLLYVNWLCNTTLY